MKKQNRKALQVVSFFSFFFLTVVIQIFLGLHFCSYGEEKQFITGTPLTRTYHFSSWFHFETRYFPLFLSHLASTQRGLRPTN